MAYRFWAPLFAVSGILLAIFYYYLTASPSAEQAARSEPATVRVARVQRVSLPRELSLRGELLPVRQFEIQSRLPGKVVEIRVDAGDLVFAGKIVAVIDPGELDERIHHLEAAVAAARRELQLREKTSAEAERLLAENRELVRRDLIPRRDLDQVERTAESARAEAELARAHVAQQEAMLAQAQGLRKLARITAPSTGLVIRRLVETGAVIYAGQALIELTNPDSVKLAAKVSSNDWAALRRGMKARVFTPAFPEKIAFGKITRLETPAKATEDLLDIEIEVENHNRHFRPGMTAEARIDLGPQEQFVIPRSAIRLEERESYVYRVADGRVWRRQVTAGQGYDALVAVDGLQSEDVVVVDRLNDLQHGGRVTVLPNEEKALR